jgi:ATP-dependent DNA helicase RecG
MKKSERLTVDKGLADGSIAIAIGTHALTSRTTDFRQLGLAVIDEQHRREAPGRLLL